MFEDASDLWKQYWSRHAGIWASHDPRNDLAAEVRDRLEQLDILLEYIRSAIERFHPAPQNVAGDLTWMQQAAPKLEAGEITFDEYLGGFPSTQNPPSRDALLAAARAAQEIELFTETFYFVAWRLREVLNRRGTFAFPGLGQVEARGVLDVRNHLIEHPEQVSKNFARHLVITSAGPVLKSSSIVVRTSSGNIDPADESMDRGLFVNAQELHDQLTDRVRAALQS